MARLDLSLPHWLCIDWYCFAYAVSSLNFFVGVGDRTLGKDAALFPQLGLEIFYLPKQSLYLVPHLDISFILVLYLYI